MTKQSNGAEWKVGIFMAFGIALIAFMAVKFGKLGTGLQKFYNVQVEFPDASGLLKGGEVRMAGARIGFAKEAPELVEGRYAVHVPLRIREGVKIPKNATFTIDTSGLMGDAYVAVVLPSSPSEEMLIDGAQITGNRVKALSDLTAEGGDIMGELKKRLQELEDPIKDVRDRLLSDVNLANLEKSFGNIREFTESLKKSGKDLDEIMAKAKGAGENLSTAMMDAKAAMAKIDGVVTKVDAAAAELKPALASIRATAAGADKAVDSARTLLNKANNGQGALGLLLSDRETAENLKSFIRNVKTKGILWYKDRPEKAER